MSPQALTSRPFSTDSGGAFPRLNGWRTRWEMGVGAAGHEAAETTFMKKVWQARQDLNLHLQMESLKSSPN
jgi:hypothetical protein